jgi:hypothetical protein
MSRRLIGMLENKQVDIELYLMLVQPLQTTKVFVVTIAGVIILINPISWIFTSENDADAIDGVSYLHISNWTWTHHSPQGAEKGEWKKKIPWQGWFGKEWKVY